MAVFGGDQSELRGLFTVEDGATAAAHSYARLDFLGADRAIGKRLWIVEPRLFSAEVARGAAFQIGDKHGIFRALPFQLGGSDETAVEFFQPAMGFGEFAFSWLFAGGDENAVITSLPR